MRKGGKGLAASGNLQQGPSRSNFAAASSERHGIQSAGVIKAKSGKKSEKRRRERKPSAKLGVDVGPAALQPAAPVGLATSHLATSVLPTHALRARVSGRPGDNASHSKGGGPSMLAKMRETLLGGHFRWLNEQLYTTEGSEALDLMRNNPTLYQQYHEGFRKQTEAWPQQPVDVAIEWLSRRPASWAVADLGCGDARVASAAEQQVHSFDLIATTPGVVACNIARLPLPAASVDAAIFCLSLMGTDYGSFLREAARVLRPAGWLWIAEVQSRFVDEQGQSMLNAFVAATNSLGFALKRKDVSNSHFLVLEFQGKKERHVPSTAAEWPVLRACQYKKR